MICWATVPPENLALNKWPVTSDPFLYQLRTSKASQFRQVGAYLSRRMMLANASESTQSSHLVCSKSKDMNQNATRASITAAGTQNPARSCITQTLYLTMAGILMHRGIPPSLSSPSRSADRRVVVGGNWRRPSPTTAPPRSH